MDMTLVRIDHGRVDKIISESQPEGRKSIEKPRLRSWEDEEIYGR
jgi:hypothetical protein